MKFFPGLAVSAALVCTAAAANAQMSAPSPYDAGRARSVSDVDGPFVGGPPPMDVPPGPRYYGYGPDHGAYAPDRGYAPEYRYGPGRDYGPDRSGYGQEYGSAPGPALLPPQEVYAILRDNGFSPLGIPRQRGYVYVIAVLDRGGEDGRLTIDGRNGRILRFVPASQWGQTYNRMSLGRGANMMPPVASPGVLPQPTRINVSPPPHAAVPSVANRAAVPALAPKPPAVVARPAAPPAQQSAAVSEAKPAAAAPAPPPQTSRPASEVKPSEQQLKATQPMPAAQGLD
jgi:hypothetical protein